MRGGRRERARRRVRGVDLEAGASQRRPERAQDLRLVVDDEDPLLASCGQLRRDLDDRAAPARTSHPAPVSTRPRVGRRSRRRSRGRSRDRDRRRSAGRRRLDRTARRRGPARSPASPGPWSTIRTIASCRVAVIRTCTWASGGENFNAFSTRFASTRWIWTGSTLTSGLSPASSTRLAARQIVHRLANQIVERPDLGLGLRPAGLEPREVEQVADQPAEPLGVDGDRVEQLAGGPRR